MAETWEQTKRRLASQGIALKEGLKAEPPKPPEERAEPEPSEPLYHIRRTILPGCKVDWLVSNITQKDVTWWLEHATRFKKPPEEIDGIPVKELIEVLSADAPRAHRSPYYNPRPFIIDENIH